MHFSLNLTSNQKTNASIMFPDPKNIRKSKKLGDLVKKKNQDGGGGHLGFATVPNSLRINSKSIPPHFCIKGSKKSIQSSNHPCQPLVTE